MLTILLVPKPSSPIENKLMPPHLNEEVKDNALTFLAPNKPSKPDKVLYQPCTENKSRSFYEPSMKHHRSEVGIVGPVCT